jgi:predicted Zn-dependent protease
LLLLYRRKWDDAEDVLQALLDLAPDNVLGMSLLAYVRLCQDDSLAALALYRQVRARHSTLSIGAAGEVWSLAALGRADEALLRGIPRYAQNDGPWAMGHGSR